jgi:prepilin-type N-terminal cleavage/methylation domain-containing protein
LRCSRRAGLTLIEVVAAIALIGTLLTAMVLARSRHVHQLAVADQQDRLVHAADALISRWWADAAGVPVGASGTIDGDPPLRWSTQVIANRPIERLSCRVVRITVQRVADPQAVGAAVTEPVVVDIVLPDPEAVEGEAP